MVIYSVVLVVLGSNIFLVSGQSTPNPDCSSELVVVPVLTYHISSPKYPESYPANRYCRYSARALPTFQMNLICTVNLPDDPTCAAPRDRLLVSPTGETTNFLTYCGSKTFSLQSEGNKLLVELHVPQDTKGGSFNCSLKAISKLTLPPICECGWKKESRIVNGQETGKNEYPMVVAIIHTRLNILFCGGTIISNKYVLTAAHCLYKQSPENVVSLVGGHDVSNGTETKSGQLFKSKRFIEHRLYDPETFENDIGLIEVEGSITFSLEVGPACLPFSNPDKPSVGDVVTVMGWGRTEEYGATSNVLLKTELDVIDISECQEEYEIFDVTDNQICTFREGTDACTGDSGGPVILDGDRVWLQGIISYGESCAKEYPGVSVRVGKYLQWIKQSTPGESYCEK